MTQPLDQQISDAGGLIALLLVFVFAYFSALLPIMEDLRLRPRPPSDDDTRTLAKRISNYRLLASSLLGVVILVLLLLGPLSWRAMNAPLWDPFQTLRFGLLLIDLLLVGTGGGITIEIVLLSERHQELTPPKPKPPR